jgi:glycosyltransferase involved in cell wall biosynthesis
MDYFSFRSLFAVTYRRFRHMPPQLSIIIPYYNHQDSLPALLDSIEAQRFDDYEIIVVDDCSDQPCDAGMLRDRGRGGGARLLKNPCRLYTKETRLRGVEAALGDYIMFADADDRLWGTDSLEMNMRSIRSLKADLLQFRILMHGPGNTEKDWFVFSMPWPGLLEGREIFTRYVHERMIGHLVCGKIARKELWRKCLKAARRIKIRRYQEDLLLASLLYLHARRFVGIEHIGYESHYVNKDIQKSCGRAVANYFMLTEFIPYARSVMKKDKAWADAEEENKDILLSKAEDTFSTWLKMYMLQYLSALLHGESSKEEIKQHIAEEEFIRVIAASGMLSCKEKTLMDLGLLPREEGMPRGGTWIV